MNFFSQNETAFEWPIGQIRRADNKIAYRFP